MLSPVHLVRRILDRTGDSFDMNKTLWQILSRYFPMYAMTSKGPLKLPRDKASELMHRAIRLHSQERVQHPHLVQKVVLLLGNPRSLAYRILVHRHLLANHKELQHSEALHSGLLPLVNLPYLRLISAGPP